MATKADSARAEKQKKGPNTKKTRKLAQRKPKRAAAEPIAAGKKATAAKEAHAEGKRPSRKSTRASANRGKQDTNLTLRSERKKSSPKERAASAEGKATRARASR